jgi:RHS repeat-associated protein
MDLLCRRPAGAIAVTRLGRLAVQEPPERSGNGLRSCLSGLCPAIILVALVGSMFAVLVNVPTAAAAEPSCHMEGRLYWEDQSLKGGEGPFFTEYERGVKPNVEFEHRTQWHGHRNHYAICTHINNINQRADPVVECTAYGEAKCGGTWRGKVPGTHPFLTHVWIAANLEINYSSSEEEYLFDGWNFCEHSCGEEAKFSELLGNRSRKHGRRRRERLGIHNPADPNLSEPCAGDPVDCVTGNLTESQTDLSVGGRGVPLTLTRTYNSQATIEGGSAGMFGFGWSSSFSDHLEINQTKKIVTVVQANGSTVVFEGNPETVGELKPPRWTQAKLSRQSGGTFLYTLPDQGTFTFNSEGRLSSEGDRNGNTTSLTYNASHQLETVTDSSGRKLTLAYNSGGQVESATDPMRHTVKYGYEGSDLTSVTEPGESSPRWRFKYESHRMTEMIDGRGGTTKNEYASNRVTKQTDPLGHITRFAYEQEPGGEFLDGANSVAEELIADEQEPEMSSETEENEYLAQVKTYGGTIPSFPEFATKITNEATGEVTQEHFNSEDQLTSITRGYGTSNATTQSFSYDAAGNTLSVTDGNTHKTRYEYDSAGNRTKMIDANEHETKWTYDSTHDVETITTPKGETTTIKRDSHGNAESVSRPAPKEATQTTKYTYDSHGDVESMTDPPGRVWKYEYDSYGDRTAEIDPEGDKRTWAYNEDSRETSTVSPRGNVTGSEPVALTTTIERDAQGRQLKVTEPEPRAEGKPADKTQPSISGLVQKGQTLTAGAGIWEGAPSLTYTYQWQHCNASGESCSNVSGATNSTYLLSGGDAGQTLRVVVTATNVAGSASSTSEATAVVSSSAPAYSSAFGSYGTGNGQLREPEGGLATDAAGNVWVSDTENSRLEEFNSKGEFVRTVGSAGTGNSQFATTYGVMVDSKGNVWATDEGNNRVEEFTGEGVFIKTFGWGVSNGESKFQICTTSCRAGLQGSGNGEFYVPEGIAVDSKGNIFVADRGNKRVQEFNSEDAYVRSISKAEENEGPFYLNIDSSGNLWVAYSWDNKIGEFTNEGTLIRTWGTAGSGPGQLNIPYGVAVGPEGHVWVSEYGNNRVQVFTPAGEYLYGFGSKGNGPGQFNQSPHGLAFYGSNVYVLDSGIWWENTGNSRVEKWVMPALESSVTYSSSFGSYGTGNGQLREPEGGLATDASGNVWVSDTENSRLEEFNSKGEFVRAVGSSGEGNGQFKTTYGVTVDSKGNVWATDEGNDRVEEFTGEGVFVKTFGWGVSNGENKFQICTSSCRAGLQGSGSGEFYVPEGVAVDSKGNIFVADRGNKRVQEFNSENAFVRNISKPEEKEGPFYVGLDSSGNLWVAYSWDNKIGEFTNEGTLIRTWGTAGSEEGKLNIPYGVAVGPEGHVWVSEYGNNRVQVFTPAGEYLYKFGSTGNGPGQFNWSPHGLAFYGSNVYVLDSGIWWENTGNSRVEKWALGSAPSNATPPSVSGELIEGQTLSAGTGTWSAVPAPTYTYQWRHCNAFGEGCSDISGATNSTYVLGHSDVGYTLRVVVTATNLAGSAGSTSAATEVPTGPHSTEYAYDANGNIESVTDANVNKTKYTYNADDRLIKVAEPNGTITEAGYDGAGRLTSQTDGNKHETKYVRNVLGQVTEVVDPLGRKTTKEYDSAGNLKTLTDPAKRTTTYTYDPANRLIEVKYSDGKTPTVKYEYDKDGERTVATDGTGTSKYTYDQLDRLTETENGHKEKVSYEYDLANEQTKITYPNSKALTRAYDKDGRLEKVTDWLEHTTQFAYDPDSNLATTTFPTGTSSVDKYAYNAADQMSEVKMTKGSETLASLLYTRDGDGQLTTTSSKSLPGTESTENAYDTNNRLTKAGSTAYEYDAANNPTKLGSVTYKYNAASQLETGPSLTYSYDELGERTKTTPSTGPATTYGYDQAGNLISVSRPEEGSTPKIEDTYAYNGNGLRASQTISGTTSYLAWDMSGGLPLILSDTANSYIYGPGGLPVEQISSGSTSTYLHHDQAGSTRLLTGSTGTVTGSTTFDAYGNKTGSTGSSTTPLGYDGQYTSSDTGLIYLRARVYDPATAQFLSNDPVGPITREPYSYGGDNPLSYGDPTGLIFGIPGTPSLEDIGTRFVGFWDGFTQPVFGGTAALRSALGLNGGLETCSTEYQIASNIGSLDASLEVGAAGGSVIGAGVRGGLGALTIGATKLAPVIAPIASGIAGGVAQSYVAGKTPSSETIGKGAVGGLVGELSTGLVPGTSASGVAGAVNTAFGFVW